jgi:plasmid stability protein
MKTESAYFSCIRGLVRRNVDWLWPVPHGACILSAMQLKWHDMSVAITIRDVPDAVRDELAARAARAGKSLQEYLRGMLVESAAHPTVDDVIARARARVAATGVRVDADSILAARDAERH